MYESIAESFMQNLNQSTETSGQEPGSRFRWEWVFLPAALCVLLIVILLPRSKKSRPDDPAANSRPANNGGNWTATMDLRPNRSLRDRGKPGPGATAEEIVASKVSQFARNRREVLHKWAEQLKIEVPSEYEQFFDVADAGNWDELHKAFESLIARRDSWTSDMSALWPLILETHGVAEVAHDWPAQQLLDYGQTMISSLRPDMVYVGGTDPGRFIPTLFNETSEGERHVVLTQNALADSAYLNYIRFLYSDQLNTATANDSQSAFQSYMADAARRLAHDEQFPNEPKQVRPGENISNNEGRFQASGDISVMAVNERILQAIMDKNPNASFALEESFALKSTYPNATLLGPIMELRPGDGQNSLTPERAAESAAYWSGVAQRLPSDSSDPGAANVLKTYSKMAAAQATLLLDHNYPAQAEANFQVANQLCPSSPEAVFGYVQLLVGQNRVNDAIAVAGNAVNAAPNNNQFRDLLQRLRQPNP